MNILLHYKKVIFLITFLFSFFCTYSQTFNYTGAVQTDTVTTDGCVTIKAWGAGGDAGGDDSGGSGGKGGGGAFSESTIPVSSGDVIEIYVGGSGSVGVGCVAGTGGGLGGWGYGSGGRGGHAGSSGCSGGAGGGGGSSTVLINGNVVLVAGGGGGGGGAGCSNVGPDGGAAGQNGQSASPPGTGGTAGSSGVANGAQGIDRGGGDGAGGGGGGGGWNGGSGGGVTSQGGSDCGFGGAGGGGGGGNSLGSIIINGSGQTPGNNGDPDLCIGCAIGGTGSNAGNGIVILNSTVIAIIANFNADTVCSGDTTNFINTTTGNVGSFVWDFGDGNFDSTNYSPSHIYSICSIFNVILTVFDSSGLCSNTIAKSIQVLCTPNADFTTLNVCENTAANFSDLSIVTPGSIQSWLWAFGDGGNSILQNPSYQYANYGVYNVLLMVTADNNCTDTITKPINIYEVPQANFSFSNECVNTPVVFQDLSVFNSGILQQWLWDFGDGVGTSTQQNPSYVFSTPDTFIVTLTVTSDSSCQSVVGYSVIVYPLPVAGFIIANTCLYSDAVFTDASTISSGSVASWQWDFGDGNTSTATNPTHLYIVDSTYNVTLIVTSNNSCFDTIVQPMQIYPSPVAGFNTNNVCLYDTALFIDVSIIINGNLISWNWDFGDGTSTDQNPTHPYSADSTYNVTLIVTSNNNCSDTIVQPIQIYPVPSAGFITGNVCLNDAAVFTDATSINLPDNIVSWVWDFDDGIGTSIIPNSTYNYDSIGLYNVQLTVTSNNNCIDSISLPVEVYSLPVVNFTSDIASGCEPLCVNFTDLTTLTPDTISLWDWDFGDGSTSNQQNPQNNCFTALDVNTPRFSTVRLIATSSNGCVDTLINGSMITAWPNPIALFSTSPQTATILNPIISFTDQSMGDPINWSWDFGDDFTETIQHPTHVYLDTGTYIIEQIINNQYSCLDTLYSMVIVQPDYIFHVPNAFTPNDDGKNDVFVPQGIGIDENTFEMFIYDRWGNLIYETDDIKKPWDGRANNGSKIAQKDVYIWLVFTRDINGKRHRYIGRVTLIR